MPSILVPKRRQHYKTLCIEELETRRLLATLTVNSIGDVNDGTCDSVHCTFREALNRASSNPGIDTIRFEIGGHQPFVIRPQSELPPVPAQTIIDASLQSGYVDTPIVELDGSDAGVATGLRLFSGTSTIRGLSIHSFERDGIAIRSSNNSVERSYIGIDTSGSPLQGNKQSGIAIYEGSENVVGGEESGNVIAGNAWWGVYLVGLQTRQNRIQSNFVGTTPDASDAIPNRLDGIFLRDGANNNILDRNVVSGNGREGVLVGGIGTSQNIVQRNLVGVDATGNFPLANDSNGVYIFAGATENLIGGERGTEGNIIGGNSGNGVVIVGAETSSNRVEGNIVGLASNSGTVGNSDAGLWLGAGATNNSIGGRSETSGNIFVANGSGLTIHGEGTSSNTFEHNWVGITPVSTERKYGNGGSGIWVGAGAVGNRIGGSGAGNVIAGNEHAGIYITGAGTDNNIVLANSIGFDPGTAEIAPNRGNGLYVGNGASNNVVGDIGLGNVFSGNERNGVLLTGALTTGNRIDANLFGIARDGGELPGNSQAAIVLEDGAYGNQIGRVSPGYGNTILRHSVGGVVLSTGGPFGNLPAGNGNTVRGNSISGSEILSIDIGTLGREPADPNDVDTGVNDLQNSPMLFKAVAANGVVSFVGELDSTPSSTFYIDVYKNSIKSPIGNTEVYLGSITVQTNSLGVVTFEGEFDAEVELGQSLVATATNSEGSTSDLSLPVRVSDVEESPFLSISAGAITETKDAILEFKVALSKPAAANVELNYSITGGSAVAEGDYHSPPGNLIIEQGNDVGSILLSLMNDDVFEGSETVTIEITSLSEAIALESEATGLIHDDDYPEIRPFGATEVDGAQYMLGQINVDVVLFESASTSPLDEEDWTDTEILRAAESTRLGLQFWVEALTSFGPAQNVDFDIDLHFVKNPIAIAEEIDGENNPEELIRTYLEAVGRGMSDNPFHDLVLFNDLRRMQTQSDWAFTIFATDNSYGKRESGNGGYFGTMAKTTSLFFNPQSVAHETGHVFYAADEYPLSVTYAPSQHYTFRSGYYDTQNLNAFEGNPDPESRVTSIMSSGGDSIFVNAFENRAVSPSAMAMVGWQDSDGNGIVDVLDIPLVLSAEAKYDNINQEIRLQGVAEVGLLQNRNQWTTRNAISINRIKGIQYRTAGGSWATALEFDAGSVELDHTFQPHNGGRIELRAFSQIPGVVSNSIFVEVPKLILEGNTIAESSEIGSTVGLLSLFENGQATPAYFELVAGAGDNDNSEFSIVDNELRTAAMVDFESKSESTIRVRGNGSNGTAIENVFTITIVDINESPTLVTLSNNRLPENQPVGTWIGDLSTIDPDAGDSFNYSLVDGIGSDDNALFSISDNFKLVTAASFDFETQREYDIRVRSTDSGGLSTERTLSIEVTDLEEPPSDLMLANNSLGENQPAGTLVGRLSVTDQDEGDSAVFTLVEGPGGTDNEQFTIEGSELKSSAVFDFETLSSYSIRVRATDSSGLSVEKSFTVRINDLNEPPTDLELTPDFIDENTKARSLLGSLSVTDPDVGEIHSFALISGEGDDDNAKFAIDGNTLRADVEFDYEEQPTRKILVEVTDSDGLKFAKALIVRIVDVNEPPNDISLSRDRVAENQPRGTVVGALHGVDPDVADEFVYSLLEESTDDEKFKILGSELQLTTPLDFESQTQYEIVIRVTDSLGLSFDKTFHIHAEDANDAPTEILLSNNEIGENLSPGSFVGEFSAIDQDVDESWVYSFAVGPGDEDNESFRIESNELLTDEAFDYEEANTRTIRVAVHDSSGAIFEKAILISIVDEVEYAAEDVNADTFVTPIDALLVINHLNSTSGGILSPQDNPRLDVNQDGYATPLDALIVINFLNQQASGEAEDQSEFSLPELAEEKLSHHWHALSFRDLHIGHFIHLKRKS